MQRTFRNEIVVVIFAEVSGAVEGVCDDADSLELGARVGDRFFVDREGLGEEFIGDFFEFTLVGDLAAEEEEAEGKIRCGDARIECGDGLMHKFVQCG